MALAGPQPKLLNSSEDRAGGSTSWSFFRQRTPFAASRKEQEAGQAQGIDSCQIIWPGAAGFCDENQSASQLVDCRHGRYIWRAAGGQVEFKPFEHACREAVSMIKLWAHGHCSRLYFEDPLRVTAASLKSAADDVS